MNKQERTDEDFLLFQKHFKRYQRLFGLTGYKVYFKHEEEDESFASIVVKQEDMIATVRLNTKLSDSTKQFKDIKRSAKHEALHLLINRLESRGRERYVSPPEIYEAAEELVVKLEELIKDNAKD